MKDLSGHIYEAIDREVYERVKPQPTMKDPLPRFSTLTTAIRAGLYGVRHPTVLHMIERNQYIDTMRHINQMGGVAEALA